MLYVDWLQAASVGGLRPGNLAFIHSFIHSIFPFFFFHFCSTVHY